MSKSQTVYRIILRQHGKFYLAMECSRFNAYPAEQAREALADIRARFPESEGFAATLNAVTTSTHTEEF